VIDPSPPASATTSAMERQIVATPQEGYVLIVWPDGSTVVVSEALINDPAISIADLRKMIA